MLNFKAMTFNYRLDEHTYISGGPTNNGGVILKWYAENLLGKKLESAKDYSLLFEALERSEPGAQGLLFLPYVLGERAPIWNSDACGVFFGMRGHHQEGHFTRAVIEGISMAMYDIAHNMADTGLSIKQIHVSGGFVQSERWLQILANLFGKKICLINIADASAIGAALLSMRNIGLIHDYQSMKPKEVKEFLPQKQYLSAYQQLFLRYRNLYEKVAPLMTPGNIIES
jgi:gluconokinase